MVFKKDVSNIKGDKRCMDLQQDYNDLLLKITIFNVALLKVVLLALINHIHEILAITTFNKLLAQIH